MSQNLGIQPIRLENCLWGYQQNFGVNERCEGDSLLEVEEKKGDNCQSKLLGVRLETPQDEPQISYKLAYFVIRKFDELYPPKSKCESVTLECSSEDQDINGRWRINKKSHQKGCKQCIPCFRKAVDERIITYTIKKEKCSSCCFKLWYRIVNVAIDTLNIQPNSMFFNPDRLRLSEKPFSDPFTILAARSFQTNEPNFVSEVNIRGAFRYSLGYASLLSLIKIEERQPTAEEIAENKLAVCVFRKFVIEEYGVEYVDYVETNYGFNLSKMKENGEPLLADHVFKMNIGVNNIELIHVESLYKKLVSLKNEIEKIDDRDSGWLDVPDIMNKFSIRELRVINNKLGLDCTIANLYDYLCKIVDRESTNVKKLLSSQFNEIVEMLVAAPEDRVRAFTGREIRHLAICGHNTMGSVSDPSRNLFELLHIFSDLEKGSWDNFYELLSHVVANKCLFRKKRDDDFRCGLLIPAPKSEEGEMRWYYVDAVYIDRQGDVSYVLLPACDYYSIGENPLAMIKLYSSASSTTNPQISFEYEIDHFDRMTIPVWVGYLLQGEAVLEDKKADEIFNKALLEYQNYDYDKKPVYEGTNPADKYLKLMFFAKELKELPEYKIAQDIVFVGHSFGGCLAQKKCYFFGPDRKRIPLPGANFCCFAFNSPAINEDTNELYMRFGRKNRDLILSLGQKWKINYQMEYGDVVPERGLVHLGTKLILGDDWLEVSSTIFKTKDRAEDLSITTCKTDEKRIGLADPSRDYSIENIQPEDLYEFNNSSSIDLRLKNLFGYRILMTQRLSEDLKRCCGVLKPMLSCSRKIYDLCSSTEASIAEKKVLYIRYKSDDVFPYDDEIKI